MADTGPTGLHYGKTLDAGGGSLERLVIPQLPVADF
jgi:hypothetical protein